MGRCFTTKANHISLPSHKTLRSIFGISRCALSFATSSRSRSISSCSGSSDHDRERHAADPRRDHGSACARPLGDSKGASGLSERNASLLDQSKRLKLELAAELPSPHSNPPAPSVTRSRCPRNRTRPHSASRLAAAQVALTGAHRHPGSAVSDSIPLCRFGISCLIGET